MIERLIPGLSVLLPGAPALAQPANEFVVGSFHAAFGLGDITKLPSAPTVDVRFVSWTSERWGISQPEGSSASARSRRRRRTTSGSGTPCTSQVLARYRMGEAGGNAHFGIGGGIVAFSETLSLGYGDCRTREEFSVGLHLSGVGGAALDAADGSAQLEDRRDGGRPLQLDPVALLAWEF